MKILVPYYSRTGHTEQLALRIADELGARGHEVLLSRIEVTYRKSRWNLLVRQMYQYPLVVLSLLLPSFRRWWLRYYLQPEDEIQILEYPDVSGFDHVCIGGPKWCYLSYPVARYLKCVKGMYGKNVSAFATFGGPPLEVFELELIFSPMSHRINDLGATLVCTLGLSSNYHELIVLPLFKLVTRLIFGRSLESFTIESDYGKNKIRQFCDGIERHDTCRRKEG